MNTNPQRRLAAEFDQGQVPTIACINQAKTPLGVDWEQLLAALDEYANTIFAPVWGTPATINAGTGRDIPAGCWALVFLDHADAPNALGYHDLTPEGLPLSKVFVETTLHDHQKVSVTAAHELAEMLVDPGIQMGGIGPDGRTWYAYEGGDAVESEGFDIPMSNFVYPSWFEAFRAPNSVGAPNPVKFDHLGLCRRPFELLPGGYMPVFKNGAWTQIFGSHKAARRFKMGNHPRMWARPCQMRRYQIREAQRQLRDMGFYHGKIDGIDDELTHRAMCEYQKKYGGPHDHAMTPGLGAMVFGRIIGDPNNFLP